MMFSKDYCGFCKEAQNLLKKKGVNFQKVEMDMIAEGDQMHKVVKSVSNYYTVPLIYIAGQKLGGCDDLKLAEKSGVLDQMLKKAGVSYIGEKKPRIS